MVTSASGSSFIVSDGFHNGEDDDGDGNNGNDDDIYIMMKCLFVYLSVTKNDHFPLPS